MLKAASTSDSAEEEILQTRICQTRCSFSHRRRGHLLWQPSRSRGECKPMRGGSIDVRLEAEASMLTIKAVSLHWGPISLCELVFHMPQVLADKQGGASRPAEHRVIG